MQVSKQIIRNTVFGIVSLLLSLAAYAGSPEAHDSHTDHHYTNGIGLFLGATTSPESTDFTYGFELAHLLGHHFGAKVLLEHTPTSEHGKGDLIGILLLTLNPYKGIYIGAGPGFKRIFNDKTEALGRVDINYAFQFPHGLEIAPDFSTDFIDNGKTDKVYGVIISKLF